LVLFVGWVLFPILPHRKFGEFFPKNSQIHGIFTL
jgi:hypothetical protein